SKDFLDEARKPNPDCNAALHVVRCGPALVSDHSLTLPGETAAALPRQFHRHWWRLDPGACGQRTGDASETGEVDPGNGSGDSSRANYRQAPFGNIDNRRSLKSKIGNPTSKM